MNYPHTVRLSGFSRFIPALLRLLALAGALAGLANFAAAQSTADFGTVVGQVTDQVTGDRLAGAIVSFAGTDYSTTSEMDGTFRLRAPAGNHTLVVQYTGLDTASFPVAITAGAVTAQDVPMTAAVYRLNQYTVSGLYESEGMAIQLQRDLPNVAEVESVDAYGLPEVNPGMLLAKMPEVTVGYIGSTVRTVQVRGLPANFTGLMVDGNNIASSAGTSSSRQIQIEQFGLPEMSDVELVLEPTPDMDGDYIGGVINLVTRRVYEKPDNISITVGTNWADQQNASAPVQNRPFAQADYDLSLDRTFSVMNGKNNLGIQLVYDHNHQNDTNDHVYGPDLLGVSSELLFPGAGGNTTGGPMQTSFGTGFIYYGYSNDDTGGIDIDFKPSDQIIFSLRTTYNRQYYIQQFYRNQISAANSFASFLPGSTPDNETTTAAAASSTDISSNFTKKSVNFTINPEAIISLFKDTGKLDVQMMYSYADIWYPDYYDVDATDAGIGFNLNRVGYGAFTPQFTQTAGPSISSPSSYLPTSAFRDTYGAPDTLSDYRLDYTQNFDSPVPSFIKVGFKYSAETRTAYSSVNNESAYTGPTNEGIVPWVGKIFRPSGQYGPYPFFNIPNTGAPNDIATLGYFGDTPANAFANETSTLAANVTYKENIAAPYVEASVNLGPVTVMGGVREEFTNVEGSQLLKTPGAANATLSVAQNIALAQAQFGSGLSTDHSTYKNALPGIFVTYQPLDGLILKGSYNVTITRPPVANILPGTTINPTTQTITENNPSIKPYTAQNFELNLAKYFEPDSVVEVGAYYKQVSNYISSFGYTIGSGFNPGFEAQFLPTYAGYTVTTDVNSGGAVYKGLYVSYRQQFTNLPGFLSRFGVFGTAAWVNVAQAAAFEQPLPFTSNYGLSYLYHGLQMRLLANYIGDDQVGGTPGSVTEELQKHRTILTLNGDYQFRRNWDAFFEIDNLTNEPVSSLFYDGIAAYQTKTDIGFLLGARYTIK